MSKETLGLAKEAKKRADLLLATTDVAVVGSENNISYLSAMVEYHNYMSEHRDDGYHDKEWNRHCRKMDEYWNRLQSAKKQSHMFSSVGLTI